MSNRASWTVNFTCEGYRRFFIEIQKQGLGPLDFDIATRIVYGHYGEHGCGTDTVSISSYGGFLRSYHWDQIKTALDQVPPELWGAWWASETEPCPDSDGCCRAGRPDLIPDGELKPEPDEEEYDEN